jgi:hypothetical protein
MIMKKIMMMLTALLAVSLSACSQKKTEKTMEQKVLVAYLVSQAFRSRAGAESFAVLHSVMDTAKKNGMPIFQAVRAVVEYQPIALHE